MEVVMKIDARLPAVRANQASADRLPDHETAAAAPETGAGFFISPMLRFDSRSLTVIFEVRDSDSGDVIRQFPPETAVARSQQDPSTRPFVLPTPSVHHDAAKRPHPGALDTTASANHAPPRTGHH